ncbi:PREDICTED: uncharacterized protein LOC107164618 [Diuraphis noxia]|uniref:uncharacterized protein LOC107164618 n=1 Tax=Diuraphis noxia TaxID=143948 RepID=UPI000763AFB5|nr:PREDICTED: uncharacterized protein LOC107164618 [Diuraphis noxia]
MNSTQYQKCYTVPSCDKNTLNETSPEPNSPQHKKCYTEPTTGDQNIAFKTCQEPKSYPEPETSFKTCQEPVKDHCKKEDCGYPKPTTETGQYHKCCALSPVAPTPLVRIDCCEKARPCRSNFCSPVNDDCDDFELTPYGKEFVLRTGRIIHNCSCVKLNGLQDSCKHAGCCTRIGCTDIPFPNCLPARLWKNEYICKNKKKPKSCPDVSISSTNKN